MSLISSLQHDITTEGYNSYTAYLKKHYRSHMHEMNFRMRKQFHYYLINCCLILSTVILYSSSLSDEVSDSVFSIQCCSESSIYFWQQQDWWVLKMQRVWAVLFSKTARVLISFSELLILVSVVPILLKCH